MISRHQKNNCLAVPLRVLQGYFTLDVFPTWMYTLMHEGQCHVMMPMCDLQHVSFQKLCLRGADILSDMAFNHVLEDMPLSGKGRKIVTAVHFILEVSIESQQEGPLILITLVVLVKDKNLTSSSQLGNWNETQGIYYDVLFVLK